MPQGLSIGYLHPRQKNDLRLLESRLGDLRKLTIWKNGIIAACVPLNWAAMKIPLVLT